MIEEKKILFLPEDCLFVIKLHMSQVKNYLNDTCIFYNKISSVSFFQGLIKCHNT